MKRATIGHSTATASTITGQLAVEGNLISIDMTVNNKSFTPPSLFPRLFVKVIPRASQASAALNQVIVMRAETTAMTTELKGDASVTFEPSDADPLHELGTVSVLGANYLEGHQILPWRRS